MGVHAERVSLARKYRRRARLGQSARRAGSPRAGKSNGGKRGCNYACTCTLNTHWAAREEERTIGGEIKLVAALFPRSARGAHGFENKTVSLGVSCMGLSPSLPTSLADDAVEPNEVAARASSRTPIARVTRGAVTSLNKSRGDVKAMKWEAPPFVRSAVKADRERIRSGKRRDTPSRTYWRVLQTRRQQNKVGLGGSHDCRGGVADVDDAFPPLHRQPRRRR